jgi:hypothetical protein
VLLLYHKGILQTTSQMPLKTILGALWGCFCLSFIPFRLFGILGGKQKDKCVVRHPRKKTEFERMVKTHEQGKTY